jgi:hypothetical protein
MQGLFYELQKINLSIKRDYFVPDELIITEN